ncbi:hypothetical protein ACA910_018177 [Epithemia clementina (nom. ined.)]
MGRQLALLDAEAAEVLGVDREWGVVHPARSGQTKEDGLGVQEGSGVRRDEDVVQEDEFPVAVGADKGHRNSLHVAVEELLEIWRILNDAESVK